jgi:FkbM family methyltransferase
MPSTPQQDLIIDVGMCDGADTEYYLHKGYRVVAVEADPMLAQAGCKRFSSAVASGKLKILNIGIGAEPGTLTFYRNLTNLGESSFDRKLGTAHGKFEEFPVSLVTLASVIEEHGVPFYLKVDIEGYDEIALSTLRPELAPAYLSAELNFADSMLELLRGLGYSGFKLITQDFHTTSLEIAEDETLWRFLRKASRSVPGVRSLLQSLPHSIRPKLEWDQPWRPDGFQPQGKFSGPFAEETHGDWTNFATTKAKFDWVRARQSYAWWDVHARK